MPAPARRDGSASRLQWHAESPQSFRRPSPSPSRRYERTRLATESPLRVTSPRTPTTFRTESPRARSIRTESPRIRRPRCESPHTPKGAAGISLNNADLKSIRPVARENPNLEFLYLRENNFSDFDPWQPLKQLKVLDLSLNGITNCDFMWDYINGERVSRLRNLRHLYLTGNAIISMQNFNYLPHLETLTLSSNAVASFEGLVHLDNLRVLSLHHNDIETFRYFPHLPSLNTLNLVGNPVSRHPSYKILALAMCPPEVVKIDNRNVADEERRAACAVQGRIKYAVLEGFLPLKSSEDWESDAEKFTLDSQRKATATEALQLLSININKSGDVCMEKKPLHLHVCMKDTRSRELSHTRVFQSEYIVPMEFRVQGCADKVYLKTNVNGWVPVEMTKDEDGGYFSVTLYVTPGVCLYKYVVDDEEIVDEPTTEYEGGLCTVMDVPEAAVPADDEGDNLDSVLHIRWLRSNSTQGWDLIPDENGSSYTPCILDVGNCLRVEVLSYLEGQFQAQVYHVSHFVEAGHPAVKTVLEGRAVEGSDIVLNAEYSGGVEQGSIIEWYRESITCRTRLKVEDPRIYRITIADVSYKIVAVYTPRRIDGALGEAVECVTDMIMPLPPTCTDPRIVTDVMEGRPVVVEFDYKGGHAGKHRYEWKRWDDRFQVFVVDETCTTKTITPHGSDVGHSLDVTIIPVSSTGTKGKAMTITTPTVAACVPQVTNLRFSSLCEENYTLKLQYTYMGGEEGSHTITWEGATPQRRQDEYRIGLADVGRTICATILPCRSDGAAGASVAIETPVIVAGKPHAEISIIGEALENTLLRLDATYSGGKEGDSVIQWGWDLGNGNYQWDADSDEKSRLVTEADVGHTMSVKYRPVRNDGMPGKTVVATMPTAVKPEGWTDSSCYVTKTWVTGIPEVGALLKGRFTMNTRYSEEMEYQWLRSDSKVVSRHATFTPSMEDLGQTVKFGAMVPGSSVSWRYSPSTEEIREEILTITFPEEVVEGDVLTGLLSRREKNAIYEWKLATKNDFKIVGNSERYVVARGDVGKALFLTCDVPATSFGGEDSHAQASTVPIGCVEALGIQVENDDVQWGKLEDTDVLMVGTKLTAQHRSRREGVTVEYSWERQVGSRWQNASKGSMHTLSYSDQGYTMRLLAVPSVQRDDTPFQQGTRAMMELGTVKRPVSKRASSMRRSMSKGASITKSESTPPRAPSRTGSVRGRQAAPREEKPLTRGSSTIRALQGRSSSAKKSSSVTRKTSNSRKPPSSPATPDRLARKTSSKSSVAKSEISLENIPTVNSSYHPAGSSDSLKPDDSFSSIQRVTSTFDTPREVKSDDTSRSLDVLSNEEDRKAVEEPEDTKEVLEAEERARSIAEARRLEMEAQQEADEILAQEEAAAAAARAAVKKPQKKRVRVTAPSDPRRPSLGNLSFDEPPTPDTVKSDASMDFNVSASPPRLNSGGPPMLRDGEPPSPSFSGLGFTGNSGVGSSPVQVMPSFTGITFTCGAGAYVSTPIPVLTHYKGGGVEGRSVIQWQKRYSCEDWTNIDTPDGYTFCGTADDSACQFRVAARPVNIEGQGGEVFNSDAITMKWSDTTRNRIAEALGSSPSFSVLLDGTPCELSLSEKRLQVRRARSEGAFLDVIFGAEHNIGAEVVGWETEFDVITTSREKGLESYSFTFPKGVPTVERDFLVLLIRVWAAMCDYQNCKKLLGKDLADQWQEGIQLLSSHEREDLLRSAFQPWQPSLPGKPSFMKGNNIRALQSLLCL